jgi:hypothetical protein
MADFHISKRLLIIIIVLGVISITGEFINLITLEDFSQFRVYEISKVLQSIFIAFLVYYFIKKYQQQHE